VPEQRPVVHGGGPGLVGLLFLVFLVLKLTGVISWSWWWVTAPLWGGVALLLLLLAGAFLFVLAGERWRKAGRNA
jgi:hypothetical protein